MTSKVHKKLERDVKFLEVNQIPMEVSGVKVDKLDYEGDSEDDEKRLNDEDVKRLCEAISGNSCFTGPLILKNNNLTDLVSYTSSLKLTFLFLVLSLSIVSFKNSW